MSSFCSVLGSGPRTRLVRGPRARLGWRLALILGLIALAGLTLGGAIDSSQAGALTMLPALLLAVLMAIRPYPGEGVIARMRTRCRRPRAGRAIARAPRPPVKATRGGRLIAVALAGRAPPLALAG